MIKKFVRDRNNHKKGIVIAILHNGEIKMGYSLCKKGDSFEMDLGMNIALGRAKSDHVFMIPCSIAEDWSKMKLRAQKYFKESAKTE